MKSINIIIPYFGKFPNYYQLFLNSCGFNSTINWTIISDNQEKYKYPQNVIVKKATFSYVQRLISEKFDFNVSIDKVHKLCEYKPAYAYLFPDYVVGFDFWGYGDLDLVYGDIRKFLTEAVLKNNKIFQLGHLTLVQNEKKYNEMFMSPCDGTLLYKKAFTSPLNFNFDEQFMDKNNINTIFEENGCSIWKESLAADIYTKSSNFLLDLGNGVKEKKKKAVFVWNRGKLRRYVKEKGVIECKEYIYIHLQKRKMKLAISTNASYYKIIPNLFDYVEFEEKNIMKFFDGIKRKKINFQYFRMRYQNLKTKIYQL